MRRYYITAAIIIAVAILAIFLILGRGGDKPEPRRTRAVTASDFAKTDGQVRLTIQGRLVGQDQRRGIRISIDRQNRRLEVLNGYEESVERLEGFGNTEDAFISFTKAIDLAGFPRTKDYNPSSEIGVCPTGQRYIYEVFDEKGDNVLRSWSTSCSTGQGTFAGRAASVRQLFQTQITDYEKRISDVRL